MKRIDHDDDRVVGQQVGVPLRELCSDPLGLRIKAPERKVNVNVVVKDVGFGRLDGRIATLRFELHEGIDAPSARPLFGSEETVHHNRLRRPGGSNCMICLRE